MMDQTQPVIPHTENSVMNSNASSRSKYFWFSRCPQSTVSRHLSKYFCRNMMNEGCIFIYKNLTASECIFLTFHHLMSNKISLLIYSLGHRGKIIRGNHTKWFNLPPHLSYILPEKSENMLSLIHKYCWYM